MENFTHEIEDPFDYAELDLNQTESDFIVNTETWLIAIFVVQIVANLASIAALSVLITVIVKFKRLRTRFNYYLMHYAIVTILSSLSLPVFFLFIGIFPVLFLIEHLCIVVEFEEMFFALEFAFATILVIDWYVSNYYSDWFQRYYNKQKFIIATIYFMGLLKVVATSIVCVIRTVRRFRDLLPIIYVSLLLIVIILNFLDAKKSINNCNKTKYAFKAGTFVFLGWLPFVMFHFFEYFIHSHIIGDLMFVLSTLPRTFGTVTPIIVVYLLGKNDKSFKMAYDRLFKRNIKNYGHHNLDEGSDDGEVIIETQNHVIEVLC